MSGATWRTELTRIRPLSSIDWVAPYTREALDAQRYVLDPLADTLMARLRQEHKVRRPADMLALVRQKARSEGGIYQEFLDVCNEVPDWADFEAMKPGQRLIASAFPFMGLSLLTGSLVGAYVFWKATAVTGLTGRLGTPGDISRRLVETGQLVFQMSRPAELQPGGQAHDILMRVRLLHAAIRQWVKESGRWKIEKWDEPINQEDLAVTLSEFSFMNMRSLLRMGLTLSDEEIESHYLMWRYAGHVLGIQDFLLPDSFQQEIVQFQRLLKHEARPDKGPRETRIILDEVADRARWLPQQIRREFLYQITAHMVGDELVAGLGIQTRPDYLGIKLVRAAGRGWSLIHKRIPGGEAWLHNAGQRQMDRKIVQANADGPMRYQVKTHDPEKLRKVHKRRGLRRAKDAA